MSSKKPGKAGGLSGRTIITVIGILCVAALAAEILLLAGIFRKKGPVADKKKTEDTPTVTETVSEPTPTEEPSEEIPEGYVKIWQETKRTEYTESGKSSEFTKQYDEAGNCVYSELKFVTNYTEITEKQYDANRRMTVCKETRTSPDGSAYESKTRYEYDGHGNYKDIYEKTIHTRYDNQYSAFGELIRKETFECVSYDTDEDGFGDMDYPGGEIRLSLEEWDYVNGFLLSESWQDDSNSMSTYNEYRYFENGESVKTEYWNGEKDRELLYNAAGEPYQINLFRQDGSKYLVTAMEYDTAGRITKEISYSSDGSVSATKVWTYDAYGRDIEIYEAETDGSYANLVKKQFDDDGNMTREEVYEDGELSSLTENEFDEYGNKLKETLRFRYGSKEELYITEYEYAPFVVPKELLTEDEQIEYDKKEARIPKK